MVDKILKEIITYAAKYHDLGKANLEFQSKLNKTHNVYMENRYKNKLKKDLEDKLKKDLFRHELLSCILIYFVLSDKYKGIDINIEFSYFLKENKNKSLFIFKPNAVTALDIAVHTILTHHKGLVFNDNYSYNSILTINDNNILISNECIDKNNDKYSLLINENEIYLTLSKNKLNKLKQETEQLLKININDNLISKYALESKYALISGDHIASSNSNYIITSKEFNLAKSVEIINGIKKVSLLSDHLNKVQKESIKQIELLYKKTQSISNNSLNILLKINENIKSNFKWQNENIDFIKNNHKQDQGGFFIVASSTGSGKTIFTAKLAAQVSFNKRFTVALGLRSLTLQTKKEYDNLLDLEDNNKDTAVIIGSKVAKELFEYNNQDYNEDNDIYNKELITLNNEQEELFNSSNFDNTPILITTIDYLMTLFDNSKPKNIRYSLKRVFSSDLILDEVDNYDTNDLKAITNLCFIYGMYGRKIIVSTATPNSVLIMSLLYAYDLGFKMYDKNKSVDCFFISNLYLKEDCFMHYIPIKDISSNMNSIMKIFDLYADNLETKKIHKVAIEDINLNNIEEYITKLSNNNFEINDLNEKLSIGLIRVANIKNVLKLYKKLSNKKNIFPIAYHSNMFLFYRSYLEYKLDNTLTRKNQLLKESSLFKDIENIVGNKTIVVISTPVEEVGRDHDFDWCILEISSTRSFIQTIGRVNRHRQIHVEHENIIIMNNNFNIQEYKNNSKQLFYVRPGYETENNRFENKDKGCSINEIAKGFLNPTAKYIIKVNENTEDYLLSNKESNFIANELWSYVTKFKENISKFPFIFLYNEEFYKSQESAIFIKFRGNNENFIYMYNTEQKELFQEIKNNKFEKINSYEIIETLNDIDYFFRNIDIYIQNLLIQKPYLINENKVSLRINSLEYNNNLKAETAFLIKNNIFLGLFTEKQINSIKER